MRELKTMAAVEKEGEECKEHESRMLEYMQAKNSLEQWTWAKWMEKQSETNGIKIAMIKNAHKKMASVYTYTPMLCSTRKTQKVATLWMTLNYFLITFHWNVYTSFKIIMFTFSTKITHFFRFPLCTSYILRSICFCVISFACSLLWPVLIVYGEPINFDRDFVREIVSRFHLIGLNVVNPVGNVPDRNTECHGEQVIRLPNRFVSTYDLRDAVHRVSVSTAHFDRYDCTCVKANFGYENEEKKKRKEMLLRTHRKINWMRQQPSNSAHKLSDTEMRTHSHTNTSPYKSQYRKMLLVPPFSLGVPLLGCAKLAYLMSYCQHDLTDWHTKSGRFACKFYCTFSFVPLRAPIFIYTERERERAKETPVLLNVIHN